MKDIKSEFMKFTVSMTLGRHLHNIQGLDEKQKTLSTRKLALLVEEIEDRQKLDAVFLKRVLDYICELESKLNNPITGG